VFVRTACVVLCVCVCVCVGVLWNTCAASSEIFCHSGWCCTAKIRSVGNAYASTICVVVINTQTKHKAKHKHKHKHTGVVIILFC